MTNSYPTNHFCYLSFWNLDKKIGLCDCVFVCLSVCLLGCCTLLRHGGNDGCKSYMITIVRLMHNPQLQVAVLQADKV